MAVGDARWTFFLQPTGRVDVLARVTMVGDERFHLDTDPGFGPILEARLNRFKIRVKATVTHVRRLGRNDGRRPRTNASPPAGRRWAPRSSPARRSQPRRVWPRWR